MKGILNALMFCHERGIAHGSLGSGSVMMNTYDDFKADKLNIKLDNFGFAKKICPLSSRILKLHNSSYFKNI